MQGGVTPAHLLCTFIFAAKNYMKFITYVERMLMGNISNFHVDQRRGGLCSRINPLCSSHISSRIRGRTCCLTPPKNFNFCRNSKSKASFQNKKLKLKEIEKKMKSWVKYSKDTDFPIQNLPYGIFKPGTKAKARVGVAIGDYVLDLSAVSKAVAVR